MNIKRANAIGVASALGNKTICIRLFIYFFDTCIISSISSHLSASTKHVTFVKIVLLPQSQNKWK